MVGQRDASALRSGGGRFTAYRLNPSGTGKADRESSSTLVRSGTKSVNSYLTIDHSGVIWAATGNGLLRFDPRAGAVYYLL